MITANFFTNNRTKLMQKIHGGLVVVSAYTKQQRSNDMAFGFEQEANFWYLSGIDHPDWQLVIDGAAGTSWLIAPQVDAVHAVFDGSLSHEDAKALSGVDAVYDSDEGERRLRALAKHHSIAYTVEQSVSRAHCDFTLNPQLAHHYKKLDRLFSSVESCNKKLAELRAIKTPDEIAAMQKAIDTTVEAFSHVRQTIETYKYEYEIEAEFSYYFRKHGALGHAYDPIVAAGKNACTLHYSQNNHALKKKQFVLLDVGARKHGYAADITRTYGVGVVTKRQSAVHQAVTEAQADCISFLAPFMPVSEYFQKVEQRMRQALRSLDLDDSEAGFRRYMPHAIGHGLGVDVHDSLGAPRLFEPGMVLTVEPGVYIPEESIGVRIEDDILITKQGTKNLSAALSTAW